jgi:transcriptional repressor NrdR
MKCPYCNYPETRVIDSRARGDGTYIRRRRECIDCQKRFTTKEYVDLLPLWVVKLDGRREPFDRNRLLKGVQLACSKRPISVEAMDEIVSKVEGELRDVDGSEVPTQIIGESVMRHLKQLDEVAYVRFASVYRKFRTKDEFSEELKQLKTE